MLKKKWQLHLVVQLILTNALTDVTSDSTLVSLVSDESDEHEESESSEVTSFLSKFKAPLQSDLCRKRRKIRQIHFKEGRPSPAVQVTPNQLLQRNLSLYQLENSFVQDVEKKSH